MRSITEGNITSQVAGKKITGQFANEITSNITSKIAIKTARAKTCKITSKFAAENCD